MSRSCTIAEAQSFVRAAVPGHSITYFSADNLNGYAGLDYCLKSRTNGTLIAVVNIIRQAANKGHADLVQQRQGLKTHYLAIWRERAVPLSVTLRLPEIV